MNVQSGLSIFQGPKRNPTCHSQHDHQYGKDDAGSVGFENHYQYITDQQQLDEHAQACINGRFRACRPAIHYIDGDKRRDECQEE